MNKIYTTLILIFFFNLLQAQNWVWEEAFGFSGADRSLSVTTDNIGNVYSVGYYTDSIAFQQVSLDTTDGFLLKQLPNGNVIWAHRLVNAYPVQITCDNQNYIYVAGNFYGIATIGGLTVTGDSLNLNFFIAKLDSSGNAIWINPQIIINSGDVADIGVSNSGDVFITGFFNAYFIIGSDTIYSCSKDVYMAKIDNGGSISWYKTIQSCGKDFGKGLAIDSYGDVYFTGHAGGNADTVMLDSYFLPPSNYYYIAKISNTGNVLWFQGDSFSEGNDVAINTNDEIFVTGRFWGTTYFGNDTISTLNTDQFVNKMDVNGNVIWSKQSIALDTTSIVEPLRIECDSSNGYYILNNFSGNFNFDTTNFNTTYFVCSVQKYTTNGNILFVKPIQGDFFYTNDIVLDSNNNIYIVGEFGSFAVGNHYIIFDSDTLFSFGGYDVVIAKLSNLNTNINEVSSNHLNLLIYPNPFSSSIFISFEKPSTSQATITIKSALGQTVFIKQENNLSGAYIRTLDLNKIASGIYLLELIIDEERIVRKIVKE